MNPTPVVFYIDDDSDDLDIFGEAAKELGAVTYLFQDPHKLQHVLDNPPPTPTILFIDLNMPVKSGYEIIREIKTSEKLREIPLVIFSTADDFHSIQKSRDLGASYYICKPTSFNKLKGVISETLKIDWPFFDNSGSAFIRKR